MYSNVSIPLGELVPNDCYHYEIYLTENSTNTDLAYVWGDYSTGQLIKSTNDKMYVNGADMLILKTLYLKYNEVYRVTITSYYGDYDSPTIKSIENLFIFLPSKTEISGDVIIGWVSGDSINNDTIQIIDNQNENNQQIIESINNLTNSSEVDNIMSETLSGDINTVSSELGFSPLDNPFTSFLFFVIDGVYDVLTEREDITITTPYKSLNFTLSSTDFITPASEFKTFIRNMLICVYIYGNYKYFHYMITLLETARINKFMAEIGTDEFYDTDIM